MNTINRNKRDFLANGLEHMNFKTVSGPMHAHHKRAVVERIPEEVNIMKQIMIKEENERNEKLGKAISKEL